MTASEHSASLSRRRPALVGLVALALVVAVTAPAPATTDAAGGFSDVPEGNVHEPAINALAEMGMFEDTLCEDGLFCPGDPMKRWVMAVWLIRTLGGEVTTTGSSRFADVDAASWWSPYVEELADRGITKGCRTEPLLRYCPDGTVTRAEMASFLVRAFNLEAAHSSAAFTDVSEGNVHKANVDALFAAGITKGCDDNPLRYCPDETVNRGEMATFLYRALKQQESAGSGTVQISDDVPDASLTDMSTGDTVRLRSVFTGDKAVMFWFWAHW